jgi:multidrug efflux pump subunit AcrA (membrane-fusion protein)
MGQTKRRRWLVAGVVVVGGAGLALAGAALTGRPGAAATPAAPRADRAAVTVTVEPVTARPVRRAVTAVGSLYGRDEVTLSPKVEGRVSRIHHDVGDVVKPGELLLELDPVDYQLAVAEARRGLELELAKLGLKALPEKGIDVAGLPAVARANAVEKNAAAKRDRMRRLVDAVSAEDREQAETDYEVARANHRAAVLDAEATLASARQKQAALETALQKLKETKVYAPAPRPEPAALSAPPAEYVVCQRSVAEGEMVWAMPNFGGMAAGSSSTLFKLIIDRPLKLQATVPERHRGEIRKGMEAVVEVESYPGERFVGQVARVNPSVDRSSRTFQVEVHVPNADRRLSPGSFAKVAIQTRLDSGARTVPEEAVVSFAGVTKVFVVRDGRAREVPVRTGAAVPGPGRTWVEVEGDLSAGDAVVTSGQSQLADGTAVRVREADKETGRQGDKVTGAQGG